MTRSKIQLGKNGITENFIEALKRHFNKHNNVKITVLKSARHNKESIREHAEKITEKLGKNYTAKIIGFSIFLKKWRKLVR